MFYKAYITLVSSDGKFAYDFVNARTKKELYKLADKKIKSMPEQLSHDKKNKKYVPIIKT